MKSQEFWTIPNLLTYFRILLIPAIVVLIFEGSWETLTWALVLYGISALTDTFDGILARKLNQSTAWGAYIDPLADKFLVWAVYGVFCTLPFLHIPWYVVLLIVLRDLWITWLRGYAKRHNLSFSTSFIAKTKTTFQMTGITIILIFMWVIRTIGKWWYNTLDFVLVMKRIGLPLWVEYFPLVLTIIIVLFTIYTGWDYTRTLFGGEKK